MNNRIKERRKELKITQSELAERIGGVSRQYISFLEANKREVPSLVFANKISKALDNCIYRLFDLDGNGEYKCYCCE
ncbi:MULTISPECIES: helix-turn-helix transcriptional regulator [unclassified Gemella]|uniref:helix-turn-helix transcriptional regulator n=1 Tax=unclassified Gemella TaxID=2624949 RepID=UPI001C03D274|nr:MULTISPECIES: helix-turn-helix transcriptional regulator [unclassified Gemella]MBU0278667.1 helix-turn-helix transcriptional regulator [Gemella sp. zg-1178]QWQ39222.1 helix-turn-helix transcriptional regulator [Gemella sp. zg-570]